MSLCASHVCKSPQGPKGDVDSSGTGVTGVCVLPDVGARNRTEVSVRAVRTLSC